MNRYTHVHYNLQDVAKTYPDKNYNLSELSYILLEHFHDYLQELGVFI